MAKRTSRGRQRIEMKKMQNEDQLHVTFSKRRNGLIKMASEMCSLTGAQIALIVFSPGNRVYPFGNPDVKHVIDRYENQGRQPFTTRHDVLFQAFAGANQQKLNSDLSLLENEVLALKKRGKLLDQMIEKRNSEGCNLEALIQDLDLNKLEELLESANDLHKDVTKELEMKLAYLSQATNMCGTNPSGVHDGSSPIMGTFGFSQLAPIDSSAPAAKESYQNAAVPSTFDLFSSFNMGGSGSNGLTPFNSSEVGTGSAVQFAGSSRINGATEMIPGASSSNPVVSFNSMAPRFHGLDMPQAFNPGDRS